MPIVKNIYSLFLPLFLLSLLLWTVRIVWVDKNLSILAFVWELMKHKLRNSLVNRKQTVSVLKSNLTLYGGYTPIDKLVPYENRYLLLLMMTGTHTDEASHVASHLRLLLKSMWLKNSMFSGQCCIWLDKQQCNPQLLNVTMQRAAKTTAWHKRTEKRSHFIHQLWHQSVFEYSETCYIIHIYYHHYCN